MADVGLATDFRALGLNKSEIDLVIKEGLDADRADNNPKQVTIDEARGILHAIS
jgi:alcohol dehydrogenase class IV